MLSCLERELAVSNARRKIVMGYHALWSGGGSNFEKAHTLQGLLLAAICKYADACIAGDDHMLEAYADDCSAVLDAPCTPLPMLPTGAGASIAH